MACVLFGMRSLHCAALALIVFSACRARGARPATAAPDDASCAAPAAAVSRAAEPAGDGAAVFDSAWTIVRRSHWDTTFNGVDWTAVRTQLRPRAAAARTRGELRGVLSEMVSRLGQSHFSIIPQEVANASAAPATSAAAAPAGPAGTPGFDLRLLDGHLVVASVDSAGPAWAEGVRTGWLLEAVDGCALAPRLARLPKHKDARLTSLDAYRLGMVATSGVSGSGRRYAFRDGSGQSITTALTLVPTPGTITKFGNLPPVSAHLTWSRLRRDGRTIGVIRFNLWMPVLASAFDAAIDSLRGADAILIDLRGNFGGVGGMALGIGGHFLDSAKSLGTMVQRGSEMRFLANPRRSTSAGRAVQPFAGPLALVVDELSVSTSEIFAGGMQAVGRARVFGSTTAGQALPSIPEPLPNGDILYHAIADFLGPSGKPIEGPGVRPDQLVPLTRRALLAGRDPAADAALTWLLTVAPRRVTP